MGVRSDVAIAMKECVVNHLSPEAREFLEEWGFEERSTVSADDLTREDSRLTKDDLGTLFATSDVKWYHLDFDVIIGFLRHLRDCHDDDDWLLLQACHDCPSDDEGDEGGWYENPFNLCKHATVELSWD